MPENTIPSGAMLAATLAAVMIIVRVHSQAQRLSKCSDLLVAVEQEDSDGGET